MQWLLQDLIAGSFEVYLEHMPHGFSECVLAKKPPPPPPFDKDIVLQLLVVIFVSSSGGHSSSQVCVRLST